MVLDGSFDILFSGCFGGTKTDIGRGLCLLPNNEIVLLGVSSSTDLPISDGFLSDKPGDSDYDMVLMKMYLNPEEKIKDPTAQTISGSWGFVMAASVGTVFLILTKKLKRKSSTILLHRSR